MGKPQNIFAGRDRRRGFTLIEASLTTVIIGVGFLSMLQLLAAGTMTNIRAIQSTAAVNLAKNVREMTLKHKFAELMPLSGKTYQPAIDSQGKTLPDFGAWKQTLTIQPVDPDRVTLDISDPSPKAVRIKVCIDHNGERLCDVSWYAFDGTP